MLDACPSGLKLSTTIPLGPPATFAMVREPSALRAITQPEVPVPVQSAVRPKKKKSVPPAPTLGLKNSVQPVQRAFCEFTSWLDEAGAAFMTYLPPVKVNPNAYCHGEISAPVPVPQRRVRPVAGFVK